MTTTNIYGPIVDRDTIEETVMAFIQLWIDTYLAEVERMKGMSIRHLPRPRSYSAVNRFERWTQDQLPAIIVVSPGLTKPPVKNGAAVYRGKWALGIGIVVGARDQETNRSVVGLYAAAIRMLFTHKPSVGGFALGCTWLDEKYTDSPEDYRQSTAAGQVLFELEVDAVVQGLQGPATIDPPPADPVPDPGQWPEVIDVSDGATITKEPIV